MLLTTHGACRVLQIADINTLPDPVRRPYGSNNPFMSVEGALEGGSHGGAAGGGQCVIIIQAVDLHCLLGYPRFAGAGRNTLDLAAQFLDYFGFLQIREAVQYALWHELRNSPAEPRLGINGAVVIDLVLDLVVVIRMGLG